MIDLKLFLATCVLLLLPARDALADGYQDFSQGLISRNRQDWDAAIKFFSLALSEPDLPQHLKPVAYFDRGTAFFTKRQFDPAIADFTAAIQLKPDFIMAYSARAFVYAAESQYPKAVEDVTKAISLRPAYQPSYIERITLYTAEKDMNSAIVDCTTLINMFPDDPNVYRLREVYYRHMGNYDLAIADATKALSINDKSPDQYGERGFDYAAKGDFSHAVDDFTSEIQYSTDPVPGYLRKGQAQWSWGKFDDAAASFQEVLKRQPQQPYAFLWLSISQSRTGATPDPDMVQRFSTMDVSKWPGPLVALYLGKGSVDSVASAVGSAQPLLQPLQKCEADFFVAEWQQMHQPPATAKLPEAAHDCAYNPVYQPAIEADMSRMATK